MKTTAEYAIDLVATGAESCAEDDMNESEEIEDGLHHDACDLAIEMARQIRDHADVVLGWVDEQAVTRKPSDLWQAVLITDGGRVVEPGALAADDEWAICVVRRSLVPVDGYMPDLDDPGCEDVAHCWQCEDSDDPAGDDVGQRYVMAHAMARGLNAMAVAS